MRSKANNFIGGLHNSAAIPGVIVFPLRLSCRDESLMHSCLGIMDGTGQLLPSPAAGAGSSGEMNGGERGYRVYGGHVWTVDREGEARDLQESEQESEDLFLVYKICQLWLCAYLGCMCTASCVHALLQHFAVCMYMG